MPFTHFALLADAYVQRTGAKLDDMALVAVKNLRNAMKLWMKTAKEFGHEIPEPKGRRLVFA